MSFFRPAILLFLLLTTGPTTSVLSQTLISGTVLDAETREPLPGTNILIQGATTGTVADRDGRFELSLPSGATRITASNVGYRTVVREFFLSESSVVISLEPTYIDLSPIVVSASREMDARSSVPVSVSTLSASQLEHSKPSMLYEALNQVAGVYMVDLGNEQYKMSLRQPFTNKAYFLFMEDGVPLRPTGIFNPNAMIDVNIAGIERIEVLRGPASAMFGSNAVAGAVNFITPGTGSIPHVSVSGRANNYGYKRTDFDAGTSVGRVGIRAFGYAARQRNGYFDHSDFDKLALTFRSDYNVSDRTDLTGIVSISSLDTDTNGALDSLNFFTRGVSSLHTFSYRKMESFRGRALLSHRWSARQSTRITGYFRNNTISQLPYWRVRTLRSDRSRARGEINRDDFWSLGLIGQHALYLPSLKSRLIAGVSVDRSPATYRADFIDVRKDARGRYAGFTQPDSTLSDYTVGIQNSAFYSRWEIEPLSKLRITTSLRYDRVRYDYDNHLDAAAYSGAPDGVSSFSRISPKLGMTYDVGRGRGFYANYSLGFAPPEVNELYNGVKVPNLRSAWFESYEAGGWAALLHGTIYMDVSLYVMQGRDEIIPVILDDGSRENRNAGHTRHRGVEYTLLFQPDRTFSIRLSGSNARHEFVRYNENGRDYSGNTMMNAPGWIANADLSITPEFLRGSRISFEWQHVGGYELDNGNTARYGGFDVFHLRTSYSRGAWQLWLNVNNVFDTTYASTAAAYSFGTLYNAGQVRTFTIGTGFRR